MQRLCRRPHGPRRKIVWTVRVLKWTLLTVALPWFPYARGEAARTWRGLIVPHPESLSGTWEAREGSSFIGLQIHLMTQVKGRPLTLRGVDQTFLSADIEVYERDTSERKLGDGNWYQDNSAGVEWSGWHLTIRPVNPIMQPVIGQRLLSAPDPVCRVCSWGDSSYLRSTRRRLPHGWRPPLRRIMRLMSH